MDELEIEAVYERGTLKLSRELPLSEGQKVTVTVRVTGGAARRLYGSVPWKGDPEELHRFLDDPDEGMRGGRDA